MAAHTVRLHHNLTLQSSIFIVIILLLLLERCQLEASSLQGDILPTTVQSTITTAIQEHFSQSTTIFFSTPASKIYSNETNSNQSFSSQNETLSFLWFPGKNSHYSTAVAVFITLILLCVIVGTIVGNILVCVAVCLVRKLRRPCNYLLVSLAVSDLCVAILVMPMAMLYEILGNWPFGPVFCDLWVSFDVLSCTASILNLCMISVDRYYAITKPLEYGVKRTPRRMIFCVFLVWLGAACISLPPLLILGNEREESHCIVCQNFGYQIYATLGSFYIPLLVMIVVYYKIFRAARKIVMEEKRAQSHLESHCYLEINVKNGGGAESKLLGRQATPTNARSSSVATNASCGVEKSLSTIGRCFSGEQRKSNESQCPMLQQCQTPLNRPNIVPANSDQSQPKTTSQQKPKKTTKSNIFKKKDSLNVFKGHKDPKDFSGNVSSPHQKKLRFQLAKERKASTTLGIIMSAFIFCWLPFFVLALVRPFLHDPEAIPHSLSSLFLWLGYANSLLNPIIYATLNKDFRKPFQEILYFRCSNLNHMMREEFYHSQYGDPEQHYCAVNSTHKTQVYEESVEIVTADDRELKERTSESFL
ncbi:5-hydroxytryptamine receptor 1-like [Arctopsyche grandis]|uniref:5-hydroxytryptamine receptor 1-like n=1 Tax=Arctopsyche grandis TaxID=121162 RepID=UPI00406D93A6